MRHFSRKNNTGSLQASAITASAAIINIARKKRYSLLKMAANGRITYAFRSPMLLQDSQKCKHQQVGYTLLQILPGNFVPLEPRRNKIGPEKSVLFCCSRRLCYE